MKNVNEKEVLLGNILAVMQDETFGRNMSAKIVGGLNRLTTLIADGSIEADKPMKDSQNGKWRCNAAQVLQHCKRSINQKQ